MKKINSDNVFWFLEELSISEPEQYELGEFEVVCED